jgi:hypothetical protein
MEYERDVFYETKHLSIEDKKALLLDAKKMSYDWHIDKLDCSVSWARRVQKYARFNTILKKLDNSCHFVFIHRKGYKSSKGKKMFGEYCIDTGFSTMRGIDWYLFIYMDEKHIDFFIEKYKLE